MDNIAVSICCAAYNHEKYIGRCLDGFLMQKTNFRFEVLVHDDASTDKTADIIRAYEKKVQILLKLFIRVRISTQKELRFPMNINIQEREENLLLIAKVMTTGLMNINYSGNMIS